MSVNAEPFVVVDEDDEDDEGYELVKRFKLIKPQNGSSYWWKSKLYFKLSAIKQQQHQGKVCCFRCLQMAVKKAKGNPPEDANILLLGYVKRESIEVLGYLPTWVNSVLYSLIVVVLNNVLLFCICLARLVFYQTIIGILSNWSTA